MFRKPRSLQQRDRPFGIPQAEAQGLVHVFGARELLVQAAQRGVEIGSYQPVDDAAREIAAYGDLQAGGLEGRSGGRNRGFARVRLSHQLHQWRGISATEAKAGEAHHIGAFMAFVLAGMNAQAFVAQFNGHERASGHLAGLGKRGGGAVTDEHARSALCIGLLDEGVRHRKGTTVAGLDDAVGIGHGIRLRTSCCLRMSGSRVRSFCRASPRRSCVSPGAGRLHAARW
ncbi:hypothetical protein D3C87_1233330 [compost metagenome]